MVSKWPIYSGFCLNKVKSMFSAEEVGLPSESRIGAHTATNGLRQEITESTHNDLQHGLGDVLPLHYGLKEEK